MSLSNEEKERFNLGGHFEWYLLHDNGQLARATGSWRCPLGEHSNNKSVKVKTDAVYCYGCNKEFSLAKREKKEFPELPKVPDLAADDLFIGTDEAYAKVMVTRMVIISFIQDGVCTFGMRIYGVTEKIKHFTKLKICTHTCLLN